LFDQAGSEKVAGLVEKAKKNNVKLVFPVDFITADKFDKDAKVNITLRHSALELTIPNRPELRPRKRVFQISGWV